MRIKRTAVLLLLCTGFIGALPAKAGMLDLRAGLGLTAANPKGFENRVNSLSGQDLSADNFDTYNADVVLHLPVLPVTLGLRYQQARQKQSASSEKWDLN